MTKEGLETLVGIKASLNLGLSENLKSSFPASPGAIPLGWTPRRLLEVAAKAKFIPTPKLLVESQKIKDPNWLIGFIDAEGCFQVVVQKSSNSNAKTGFWVSLRFTLTQHSRDKALLESFLDYFACGKYYLTSKRDEGNFIISKFSDIYGKIIPLLDKYSLAGSKLQDYLHFVKLAELIKSRSFNSGWLSKN